jgi:hypothetical protein
VNERIITILLIVAIILSVLSISLTLAVTANNQVFSKTIIRENGVSSGNVGFIIQETNANKNEE